MVQDLVVFKAWSKNELNRYYDDNPLTFNPELQIYQAVDPIGTINRSSGSVEASFMNIEPRLSLSYLLNENSSIKLATTE